MRLDEVVLRALEKEPERRYQQASDVKTDVERITGNSTLEPLQEPASSPGSPGVPAGPRFLFHVGLPILGLIGLWLVANAAIRGEFYPDNRGVSPPVASPLGPLLGLVVAVILLLRWQRKRRTSKTATPIRPAETTFPFVRGQVSRGR